MPGFLYHLACAEIVFGFAFTGWPSEKAGGYREFLIGNLMPDLVLDKDQSHYRLRDEESGWLVPDLDRARVEFGQKMYINPYVTGAYCHLVLDQVLIMEVIGRKYKLSGDRVISRDDHRTWRLDEFLSKKHGIYGDYSAGNTRLILDKLTPEMSEIFTLPRRLDDELFSDFGWQPSGKDWRAEIEAYLSDPVEEPPGFVSYLDLSKAVLRAANRAIYTWMQGIDAYLEACLQGE